MADDTLHLLQKARLSTETGSTSGAEVVTVVISRWGWGLRGRGRQGLVSGCALVLDVNKVIRSLRGWRCAFFRSTVGSATKATEERILRTVGGSSLPSLTVRLRGCSCGILSRGRGRRIAFIAATIITKFAGAYWYVRRVTHFANAVHDRPGSLWCSRRRRWRGSSSSRVGINVAFRHEDWLRWRKGRAFSLLTTHLGSCPFVQVLLVGLPSFTSIFGLSRS